jgi:hypothetical protein
VVPKRENRSIFSIFPKPLHHRHELYKKRVCHHLNFRFSRRNGISVWVAKQILVRTRAVTKVISQVTSTGTLYPRARPNIRYEIRSGAFFQEVQASYITCTFLSLTRRPARGTYRLTRDAKHASSQTPTLQVQASQMDTEPWGTARLSLTFSDMYNVPVKLYTCNRLTF